MWLDSKIVPRQVTHYLYQSCPLRAQIYESSRIHNFGKCPGRSVAIAAEMNGLPPNPVTWQEAKAPDGRTYFYNTVTRETSWSKPEAMMTPVERALSSQPWKEYSTPDGRKYYSNSQTKETIWEMPAQYRDALDAAQAAARPPSQAPAFVAGSSTALSTYNPDAASAFESRRSDLALPQISKEVVPDYSSFQEAEAAFLKLLKRSSVQPDWSWEQAMRATIKDPQYRALKDPKDRKAAFEKFAVEVRQQERERAKERFAKLRTDFSAMLKTHPEIRHYSRWKTIRPIIERETVFRAAESEDERKQLFEEYIVELKKQNIEQEATRRKTALNDLTTILGALNLEPYTRWSQAQEVLQSHERIQTDENFKLLSKSDILTAFENHIKSLERTFNDARQQQKANKARIERQNRDAFADLLQELRARGKLKANAKWKDLLPQIESDPRYVAILGQSGSSPLELFWDAVEEEENALRGRRNDVYDVLEVSNALILTLIATDRTRINVMRLRPKPPLMTSMKSSSLIDVQLRSTKTRSSLSSSDFERRFSSGAKTTDMLLIVYNAAPSMFFAHV
jgi:pre-mRNA-processing factor 40